jgi:hypothetical protein
MFYTKFGINYVLNFRRRNYFLFGVDNLFWLVNCNVYRPTRYLCVNILGYVFSLTLLHIFVQSSYFFFLDLVICRDAWSSNWFWYVAFLAGFLFSKNYLNHCVLLSSAEFHFLLLPTMTDFFFKIKFDFYLVWFGWIRVNLVLLVSFNASDYNFI